MAVEFLAGALGLIKDFDDLQGLYGRTHHDVDQREEGQHPQGILCCDTPFPHATARRDQEVVHEKGLGEGDQEAGLQDRHPD